MEVWTSADTGRRMLLGPRLLVRRVRAQRLVLTAAVVTVLLATVLLCALTLYGERVADGGVRAALESPATRTVTITARTSAAQLAARDTALAELAGRRLAAVPHRTYSAAQSGSYGLTGRATSGRPDLATFHYLADLARHATLVAGAWPTDTAAGRVPAAVPEPVAAALGLRPGSALRLTDRLDQTPVEVVVAGVFRPADPNAAYWRLNPYGPAGVQRGAYQTFGPFAVGRTTFATRFADGASGTWLVVPDASGLRAGDVTGLRAATLRLADDVRASAAFRGTEWQSPVEVSSPLPDRLEQVDRALVASRSILLVPLLQLALLAAYALVFTARLLDERRQAERALLRARGASVRQLSGLSAREALLVTLPAAAVSPVLAALLLRWASSSGVLGSAQVRLDAGVAASTWVAAGLVALAGTALLLAPPLRPGGPRVAGQGMVARPARRSLVVRAGADLALLVIAALGYWQLRRYSSPVHTLAGSGALHVDPLLVAAPTLAMLAGALLALRLLPVLTGVAERVTARSRGLPAALGTWQVSRRPLRQSGPLLLLALALATGTFATTYSASWVRSQRDQADLRVGADLRIGSPRSPGALPPAGQHAVYGALPGVGPLMPVSRQLTPLGAASAAATVLAVDAARGAGVVRLREDLAPVPVDGLLGPLPAARTPVAGVPLPGRPARVALDVRLASTAVPTRIAPPVLSVAVLDGDGLIHRIPAGPLPADGRSRTLAAPLAGATGGRSWTATGPLTLVGVALDYAPPPAEETLDLQVATVRTADRPDAPPGVPIRPADPGWRPHPQAPGQEQPGEARPFVHTGPGQLLRFGVTVGPETTGRRAEVSTAGPADPAATLPVIIDDAAARTANADTGDEIVANLGPYQLKLTVAGRVDRWPTVTSPGGVLLVDLPSLAALGYRTAAVTTAPDEWWAAADARGGTRAAALTDPAVAAGVTDRRELAGELRGDPLGGGVRVALLGGFIAAALLAAIGYALHLGVAAWERRTEFAVLRALGAAPRDLGRLVGTEQAFLLGAGAVTGLALGLAVAWLVVPLVMLSADAARVVPPVLLVVPWRTLALLAAAALAAVLASTAALVAAARRTDVARVLRTGEDR